MSPLKDKKKIEERYYEFITTNVTCEKCNRKARDADPPRREPDPMARITVLIWNERGHIPDPPNLLGMTGVGIHINIKREECLVCGHFKDYNNS